MKTDKVAIIFIIGGDEVAVDANAHAPLQAARNKALEQGKHTGRAPEEWDVKDSDGNILDPSKKVEEFGFPDGVKLYLVPKVSGGGM